MLTPFCLKLVPTSFPQSTRRLRGDASTENLKGDETLPELEPSSKSARAYSLRMTKSKLWDPPEEDLPLLDSPLEVDSEMPVADALIKRLQDEEKEGRKALAVKGVVLSLGF